MYDRARQEFVGRRLLTLREVPISVSGAQVVTVSLHIETATWSQPVLLVMRAGREPVRLPLSSLYTSERGDLTKKQYRVVDALRRNFAVELAQYQAERAAAVPLTPDHLRWVDQTKGYLTMPSRFGQVYLYREPRVWGVRLVLADAPTGHALETALRANQGAPVKIWLAPTAHLYHTELRINRGSRPESILKEFLRAKYPQPIDINLLEGSSHG